MKMNLNQYFCVLCYSLRYLHHMPQSQPCIFRKKLLTCYIIIASDFEVMDMIVAKGP